MIKELSILNWLSLFFSFLLIISPGLLIIHQNKKLEKINIINKLLLAFCFSVSLISLIYSIMRGFEFGSSKNTQIAISIICWFILIIRERHNFQLLKIRTDKYQVILVVTIGIVISVIIYSLRNIVAGLGSDSYHHTLISQLILENGKAPNNYLPYAPLVSFSYHFAFHALSAIVSNISGIELRLLIPIIGTFLVGLSSLSTYFVAFQIFQNRIIAFIAGMLTIGVGVSPYYLINFSRFPQLLGLVFCGCFIGIFIFWKNEDFSKDLIPYVSLITVGQAFSHYRVTIMSIIGIIIYLLIIFFRETNKFSFVIQNLTKWIRYVIFTFLLFVPWLIQVFISKKNGVSGDIGKMSNAFYSLERLGYEMINYPSNILIITLLLFSMFLVIKKRERNIIWLFLWIIILLILSSNSFLGILMDTVSVTFSLYLPIFLIISWSIYELINGLRKKITYSKKFNYFFILLIIYFISYIPSHIHPEFSFVTKEDLIAFEWIKENTPSKAKFIVNTFNFDFNEKYIIGIDSGYWLPLLGNRETVTIPMIFLIERIADKNYFNNLYSIHNLTDLSDKESVSYIKKLGYTHFFFGQKGSKDKLNQIIDSQYFTKIYNYSDIYIFEID